MKLKVNFVLYALLITLSNCITIDDSENSTTAGPIKNELKVENNSVEVTEKVNEEIQVTTPSFIYKIPPTLQNVKNVEKTSEKSINNHKDVV